MLEYLFRANLSAMQILVDISEEFVARAADLGLTPEAYARELLANEQTSDLLWQQEAENRAKSIDEDRSQLVRWEQVESRLRARIAG